MYSVIEVHISACVKSAYRFDDGAISGKKLKNSSVEKIEFSEAGEIKFAKKAVACGLLKFM